MTREQKWWAANQDLVHALGWVSRTKNGSFRHVFPSGLYQANQFCDPLDDGLGLCQTIEVADTSS